MSQEPSSNGAYQGLRVLDFSMFLAGPYCTRLMADMGAEVIKIEPPGGDFLRASPPLRQGHSAYFGAMNCGKKSLCVDLKNPTAIDLVRRLFVTADVVIENFRPGVMARFGLDYETAAAIKEDIIYCSVSGYGQDGPRASRASFAPIIHAASGFDMLVSTYDAEISRPVANRFTVADNMAAVHAMVGIGAALYRRAMTGQGEFLDVAMMDSMHTVMSYEYAAAQFPSDQGPIVFRPMQTLDGFLAIAPVSQANFAALARAAGHEQWLEDPRFSARDERIKNWSTMLDLIEAWTRTTTSGAAEAALLAEGCPASAYRTIGEARVDDQVRFRGAAVEVADAVGSFEVPNSPIQFRHAHSQPGPTVPELGQDGDAILAELGYSLEQVAALRQGGALAE